MNIQISYYEQPHVDLQMFGGKSSSTTNVSSYTPTEYELALQKTSSDYSSAVAPNALKLNDTAGNLLYGSLGAVQQDYNSLNNSAQSQISNAQNTVGNLINGELPSQYTQSMQDSINSTLQNTMGSTLNGLAGKGVLNSSVTSQALNDISKNAADTTAQNYLNNVSTLNGLAGQQSSLSGQGVTTAAAAQEAAQQPALNLWNASLGLNGSTNSALSALSGTGSSTTTSTTSGGSGIWGGLLGGAASAVGSALCFVGNTKIKTPNGYKDINAIRKGDIVTSIDENGNEVESKVLHVIDTGKQNVYKFEAERGSVTCTIAQPFEQEDGTMYYPNKESRFSGKLKRVGKLNTITFIGTDRTYDMKVDGTNKYIANGFIAQGMFKSEEQMLKDGDVKELNN